MGIWKSFQNKLVLASCFFQYFAIRETYQFALYIACRGGFKKIEKVLKHDLSFQIKNYAIDVKWQWEHSILRPDTNSFLVFRSAGCFYHLKNFMNITSEHFTFCHNHSLTD